VNAEPQRAHPVNFGGIQVAAPWAIAAPGALYAVAFSRQQTKLRIEPFSPPAGVRLDCVKTLTRSEERANP
jgi:hypothetical protein